MGLGIVGSVLFFVLLWLRVLRCVLGAVCRSSRVSLGILVMRMVRVLVVRSIVGAIGRRLLIFG